MVCSFLFLVLLFFYFWFFSSSIFGSSFLLFLVLFFLFFVVLSSPLFSPSPTLLLNPSIYFSKKAEKAARKTFSTRKGKSTQRSVWRIRRIKVGVEEKKKNTGDEKGFSTFLWRVYSPPSSSYQLNYSTRFGCFFYAIMGENWMTKMLEN